MLKKLWRLNKTKDIEKVMKTGRAFYSPFLMLKVIANNLGLTRFTVIVAKRVSKKAVQRNLVKRRLREIIRLALPKIETGADVVILASPKIIDGQGKVLKYQAMAQEITQILKKARLL
jgi:ribonuclease P protein component